MAASATLNPPVKNESKSSKKKKAKSASAESESTTPIVADATESVSGDGSYESPYIKDLYKSIRNINKKITNASKVDSIVAAPENKDKSLDQLVTERKINADQKAQILKKPGLQQQLQQFEEQIAQFKKFDAEYKAASQAEKAEFEKAHTERASKAQEEAVKAAKAEAAASVQKSQENNFLLLSQFLRLAAVRRGEDEDPELPENKALEGLLGRVYTGDASAVAAMLSLVNGSSENLYSVNGEPLEVTYADLKRIALAQVPVFAPEAEEETPAVETSEYPVQSDPTIANAGLTELDAPSATANGHSEISSEVQGIPQNSGFGGEGNAAANEKWDTANDLSTSQEWVNVPRDAAETETGLTATPAAPSNVQSWADDQPDSPTEKPAPANANDGFTDVQRNNRGNNNRGQGQGQGYRGRGRGRGGRGAPRGNGDRGGARGEWRGSRGPREPRPE
ncbi:hypothetical protein HYFRA_00011483 [Hymenoscyphus fraxineus]|uniref:YAG7-like dimerisation domain-containing protein n=1 Tax=Hymenoscyphus fraxineus TaxID=746836 RepID=A0A9N9PS12_9HELO|nr:hypothetical protein HYFRA_00011483 [Hymenoscyphus fraxineus]